MISGPNNPSGRSWVAHVAQDPMMRIRLADRIYERVANRVSEASEYAMAREALESKYGIDPAERDPEREIWIFRLDSRTD
jgi:hypothetical protein